MLTADKSKIKASPGSIKRSKTCSTCNQRCSVTKANVSQPQNPSHLLVLDEIIRHAPTLHYSKNRCMHLSS